MGVLYSQGHGRRGSLCTVKVVRLVFSPFVESLLEGYTSVLLSRRIVRFALRGVTLYQDWLRMTSASRQVLEQVDLVAWDLVRFKRISEVCISVIILLCICDSDGGMDQEISRMTREFNLTDTESAKVNVPVEVCNPGYGYNPRILVARVTTDCRINFQAFKDTVLGAFRPRRGMEISRLGNSRFLFAFNHSVDLDRVLESGPWNFDNYMIILKKLQAFDDPLTTNLDWNEIFVRMDMAKRGFFWDSTLRLRVSINVSKPLMRFMLLSLPNGHDLKLQFSYEKLPNFCYLCGIIGHIDDCCDLRYNKSFGHPGEQSPYWPWLRANSRRGTMQSAPLFNKSSQPLALGSSHLDGHSSGWKTPLENGSEFQSRSSSPVYKPPHARRVSVEPLGQDQPPMHVNPEGSRARCQLQLVDESDDDLEGENRFENENLLSPHGTVVPSSLPSRPSTTLTHGTMIHKPTLPHTSKTSTESHPIEVSSLIVVTSYCRDLSSDLLVEEEFCKVLTIVWFLWFKRNSTLMDNVTPSADGLMLSAINFLAAFKESTIALLFRRRPHIFQAGDHRSSAP
ncbi:hypothetical protein BUALT_Bualt03G0129200 [Buddleja alternifolia]|uniref:CCHC-type domain-containing protein n=1 Tax=Buddleja alternifolia TaxID=168488 RepID=A0AAV6XVK8_9LAMI|nr:hypothetical protein BUALT_Bualt03G0129200 [Buddleja alternifolia]